MNAKATKEMKFSEARKQPQVADEEEVSRSQQVDVKGKKVTATYFVRKAQGGARHTLNTVFDFSNVSEAEMYSLAMYAVRVKAQALWRSTETDPLHPNKGFDKMDVKTQIVDQARMPKDPELVARKALDKLSPEVRMALLAELAKQEKSANTKPA